MLIRIIFFLLIPPLYSQVKIADDNKYNSFPQVITLHDGTLYCTYRSGNNHLSGGSIISAKSYDNGLTWTEYTVIVPYSDGNIDKRNHTCIETDERIILAYQEYFGNKKFKSYTIISDDEGHTWSNKHLMPACYLRRKIIETRRKDIIIPIYSDDRIGFYKSENKGDSWEVIWAPIHLPLKIGEPAIIELPDESILIFSRTNNGNYYFKSFYDKGKWTKQKESDIRQDHEPCDLLMLKKKLILTTYSDSTLYCIMSRNSGRTWPFKYSIHKNTGARWVDCYYPAITRIDKNQLYIVFYYGNATNTDIIGEKINLKDFKYK